MRIHRINLQALEEVPRTLEQLEKSIVVVLCNPTGHLEYLFITREPVEKSIERTGLVIEKSV